MSRFLATLAFFLFLFCFFFIIFITIIIFKRNLDCLLSIYINVLVGGGWIFLILLLGRLLCVLFLATFGSDTAVLEEHG